MEMDRASLMAIGLPVVTQRAAILAFRSGKAASVAATPQASAQDQDNVGASKATVSASPQTATSAKAKAKVTPKSAPTAPAPAASASTAHAPTPTVNLLATSGKWTMFCPCGQTPGPDGCPGKLNPVLTDPIYFRDTYLFELDNCDILEVLRPAEQPQGLPEGKVKITVVLNRTIFHPQGGGQQADNGTLSSKDLPELTVTMVSSRKEDGAVLHDCTVEPAQADVWVAAIGSASVSCRVDAERRRVAARVHSAGHLLDAAVTAVGLKWIPGKGYHFPDGPYVEYMLNDASRKIDPKKAGEKEAVVAEVQANIDRLVAEGGKVGVLYKDGARRIEMVGEVCPCGGTHVGNFSEIGRVQVKKIQNKQGNVRLSYTVSEAA